MLTVFLIAALPELHEATRPNSGLTDGLEAVERVGNADEVLPVVHTAAGVKILPGLLLRGEVRGAVNQPEALIFIQQDDT